MKKTVIAIMLIVLIIAGVILTLYIKNRNEKLYREELITEVNLLIDKGNYKAVYDIANQQDEELKNIVSEIVYNHAAVLCEQAQAELLTDRIIPIRDAGFDFDVVNTSINFIDDMNDQLRMSSVSYDNGIIALEEKDYDNAITAFEAVIEDDDKYLEAQNIIADLSIMQMSWNSIDYGRSLYSRGYAYDDEYIYMAYNIDNVDGIYKISADGTDVQFIPLNNGNTRLEIYGINIVGEYIYFIAGENIGSGYVFESPYNIYKIRKDGTELSLEIQGNFIDLFIKNDTAYALSREYGLIQYDKYLRNQTIISDQDVIEFFCTNDGLYYAVRENLEHDAANTIYFYDGNQSTEIASGEHMHYYPAGDRYLKWWAKTDAREELYIGDSENELKITQSDIYKVFGIIDEKIIYSTYGRYEQEYAHYYNITTGEIMVKNSYANLQEYRTLGIFCEQEKLIVEKENVLYFSDAEGQIITEIAIPEIAHDLLDMNMQSILQIKDSDLYFDNDEELICVIEDKQIWYYKGSNLNLYIEKQYLDQYDTNVYVTHIFTNDYSLFNTANGSGSHWATKTFRASYIADKYQIIYGQNTDTFLDNRNIDRGIIIRNGEVLRKALLYDMLAFYDDGSMKIYRYGDDITGNQLVEDGVMMSFSFGPVLVEDYNILGDCAFDELADRNPRSAIGYVEPGHYVMIVCDGRDEEVSRGLSMIQLAQVFEDEGCQIAYNLDGGTTSTIMFFGNYITRRTAYPHVPEIYNHRTVAELFYIGVSDLCPLDLTEYTFDYSDYIKNNR